MIEILTYILIGLSLSIDAFTVAISYGTVINKKSEKILMTLLIGSFHFILPLVGDYLANVIKDSIIVNTRYIVLIIFIILIIEMIKDNDNKKISKNNFITIIIISIIVSIDSFSIGLILGLAKEKTILASSIFSIISSSSTLIGIKIGNIITEKSTKTAKKIGILLLITVALKYLLYL